MTISDSYCKGEILGNPDISGIGVVWATWTLSFLVIIMSFWVWGLLYFVKTPEDSRWYRPSTKALQALGDTQLITALALALTSLIFITAEGDTSLYHVFVARGLVNTNISGYGAALMLSTKDQCNYHFRWIMLVVFMIIYLVWNEFCIRDFQKWQYRPPLCFQNENFVPGEYVTWMFLDRFWTPIGFLWVLLEPLDALQGTFNWIEDELPKQPKYWSSQLGTTWQSRTTPVSSTIRLCLALAGYASLVLLSFLGILLSVITITPPFFTPWAELFFFVWSAYDVYKVRQVNEALGTIVSCPAEPDRWLQCSQNPESQFGFGQILPFCLLLSTVLQLSDIYYDGGENKKKVRIGNLNRIKTM